MMHPQVMGQNLGLSYPTSATGGLIQLLKGHDVCPRISYDSRNAFQIQTPIDPFTMMNIIRHHLQDFSRRCLGRTVCQHPKGTDQCAQTYQQKEPAQCIA